MNLSKMTLLTLVISIQSFFSQEVFTKMTFELLVLLPDRFFFPPGAQSMRVFFHDNSRFWGPPHLYPYFYSIPPPPLKWSVIKRCQYRVFERLLLVCCLKSMWITFALFAILLTNLAWLRVIFSFRILGSAPSLSDMFTTLLKSCEAKN